MGQYSKAIITAAGQSLIARAIAGEAQLNITKAKTSDYKYPDETDYKVLTDLEGIKQVLDSPETKALSNDLIQTRVLFSNEEIKATYYIQNIGLYAMDGAQEVLFCIVTATTPDEMPQYNGVAVTSYIYNIQNAVQDAAELNIIVSPSGTATLQDVLERVDATGGDISETVIDTLEPIDTKYPIPVAGESTKVFMGKVVKYIEDTKPLDADLTMYVATTGSDTTGDGTSTLPYKTINYALSLVPKNLGDYTATINIADGTYAEDVRVSGFYTGFITIRSSVENSFNANCVVQSITVATCFANVKLQGLTIVEELNKNAILIINSHTVDAVYVRCLKENPATSCVICVKSYVNVINCELSNHLRAVYVTEGGTIFLDNSKGTGDVLSLAGSIVTSRNSSFIGSTVVNPGGILVSPYGASIGTLQQDTTLYVATTGSDTTGDGTSSSPYKTIQYAINTLPKDLRSCTVTINIADGTYDERLVIRGFYNGFIKLISSKPEEISTVCNLIDVTVFRNNTIVDMRGINFTTTTTNAVYAVTSDLVIAYYCQSTSASTWSGFSFDQTRFETYACLIANKGIALMAHGSGGNSHDWNTSSVNNTVGIHSEYGSIVTKRGVQPVATAINERSWHGGTIINANGTQISDIITSGLTCTWGTIYDGGYIRHGNLNGVAMVTVMLTIFVSASLSAYTAYSITGFPKPLAGVGVCATAQWIIHNCFIDINGILRVTPNQNFPAGNTITFNCTYLTSS